ncbi:hypothetical protein IU414_06530 [Nocardia farcinica]|uniref:hypothetical protein n=1 Tax=Nocardia farcinica TaxID=37329 RepID=UPI0018943F16|nr:hypothetical protein [Nocardia farcinica]MBF6584415.1 hypothetical protein [Nocardia farcinica]
MRARVAAALRALANRVDRPDIVNVTLRCNRDELEKKCREIHDRLAIIRPALRR